MSRQALLGAAWPCFRLWDNDKILFYTTRILVGNKIMKNTHVQMLHKMGSELLGVKDTAERCLTRGALAGR